ncbi:MAG: autotransporter assembly complex protein TamA [Arenicella sp.]
MLPISISFADDRGPFNVVFLGVDGAPLENIKRHVRLVSATSDSVKFNALKESERQRLRDRAPLEIKQALEPFGYYNAVIDEKFDINTEMLIYRIVLNQPVRIRRVNIRLSALSEQQMEFVNWQRNYGLLAGQILDQAVYEKEKKQLLSTAIKLGYFDAKFSQHNIVINEARTVAEINLSFDSGVRYVVDSVNIQWQSTEKLIESQGVFNHQEALEDDILNALIRVNKGEKYDVANLTETQQRLTSSPYFSSVEVRSGVVDKKTNTVPIDIVLTPSKRQAYHVEVGAGTDTGARGGIGYENRRINQRGHTFSARLGGSDIKRSAIVNYRVPKPGRELNNFNLFATLEDEDGETRRFQLSKAGVEQSFGWKKGIISFGLTASREKFTRLNEEQAEFERTVDLLMPSVEWERTQSDDLYFPTKGWSVGVKLSIADDRALSDISLAQSVFNIKGLYPLGVGSVKTRLKLASSLIDDSIDLPESLGFLAGGDDSIRGYRYESIGVTRNGEVTGAKNLITASLEYQHPLKNGFAIATFIDAGDAFDGSPDYKKGIGVGVRWRLPFGALKFDLASALDRDGNPLRLHFNFGTDL